MADKPSDFFVSIINFFGILLPGALLCYVLLVLLGEKATKLPYLDQSPEGWIAFILVSYLLGHFISLAGASLDKSFDSSYVLKMLHNDVKPFSLARQVNDSLLDKKARVDAPREPDLEDKPTLDEAKEVTRWANTFIRLLSPDASLQLDQLEADSKFFRSLSVVLFVCAFACFIYCLSACFGVVVIHFSRAAFCELLCLLLLFLSLWRYANLRWKRTRLSYEFLVALNRTGKLNGVSE